MAVDFDEFPLYDPLVKHGTDKLADSWVGSLSTFYQSLIGYLTQYGMLLPVVTTAQRDSILSPQEGQLIYNIDAIPQPPNPLIARTAQVQVWQVIGGVAGWRVFTTV